MIGTMARIAAAASLLALPSPLFAETKTVAVSAQVVKPLTLKWEQDLNLGSILLAPGSWSGATVAISQAGILTCTDARLTCTGLAQPARYRATGSNRMVVRISAPNVTLVNQSDPSQTLVIAVDRPQSVTLTSSGAPGNIFNLGGSIALSSSTAEGVYVGTFNVTVDY